jgi:hypothetical protein
MNTNPKLTVEWLKFASNKESVKEFGSGTEGSFGICFGWLHKSHKDYVILILMSLGVLVECIRLKYL